MSGTQDTLVPTKNAVNMAARIPGAWLVQVPGAGHGVLLQEPDLCCGSVELFLGRTPEGHPSSPRMN